MYMPEYNLCYTKLFLPYPQRCCHSCGSLQLFYQIVAGYLAQPSQQAIATERKNEMHEAAINFAEKSKFLNFQIS